MTHPLIELARRLDRRRARARQTHRLDAALSDPHLARDLGLPHRARRTTDRTLW